MGGITGNLLAEKIEGIPDKPGVYIFKDGSGRVIYVGKATSLRKRVRSYFVKRHRNAKLAILVSSISDIDYIVTENEGSALILENNLIKEYKPRYNVQWRDDKTYPWMVLTSESYPRLLFRRRIKGDEDIVVGPFHSSSKLKNIISMLRKVFYIRSCHLPLSPTNIAKKKWKPCMEYHIGRCKAPCCGLQSHDDYIDNVIKLREVLMGGYEPIIESLERQKEDAVSRMEFEKAHEIKMRIDALREMSRQTPVHLPKEIMMDVVGYAIEDNVVSVCYMCFRHGRLVSSRCSTTHIDNFASEDDIIRGAVSHLCVHPPPVIISPRSIEMPPFNIREPQEPEEEMALNLCLENARAHLRDATAKRLIEEENKKGIAQLQNLLSLPELPDHIECFDNSNLGSVERTSACVVFIGGVPAKKLYRYYRIKGKDIKDDYSAMYEVLMRRYTRLLKENRHLPHIIILDGGKGHLNIAVRVLRELGIADRVFPLSIAKKKEVIYTTKHPEGIYLDKNDPALKLIQRMRDEAHRFCRKLLHKRNQIPNKKMAPHVPTYKRQQEEERE